ncbi:MAG: hypothetical protein J6125_01395 [Clostridia bacterium]|nr:hypothetical protein [Clostridia bacterium]
MKKRWFALLLLLTLTLSLCLSLASCGPKLKGTYDSASFSFTFKGQKFTFRDKQTGAEYSGTYTIDSDKTTITFSTDGPLKGDHKFEIKDSKKQEIVIDAIRYVKQ